MKEQKLTFWVCKSGGGQACIFTDKPKRDCVNKIWYGTVLSSLGAFLTAFKMDFPEIKWEDEPKKMTMTIKF